MRYRHLRRTVLGALAAIAFLLVLGLLAQRLINSPFARRTATNWLIDAAARSGVDLDVTSLRWGLLPPRLYLEGVSVSGNGIEAEAGRLELEMARIRFAPRTLELGTVAARAVSIQLTGIPEQSLRSKPGRLRVTVRHLDVDDVSFHGTELPGNTSLGLDGLSAAWTTEDDVPRGFVTVDNVEMRATGMEPIEVALDARIEIQDGVTVPMLRLRGRGIFLEGHGYVSPGAGARLTANGAIDLAELDTIVHAAGSLSGEIEFSGDVDTSRGDLVALDVRSRHIEAGGFPIDNLTGRMFIEADAIRGTLHRAEFFGGSIGGSYHLAHLTGPTRPHSVTLQGEGIGLGDFLDELGVPDADLGATFSADVELAWNGRAISRAFGEGVAIFEPTGVGLPAEGRLDCSMTGEGLLRFGAEDIKLGKATMSWQGPLTIGSWEPAWSVSATDAALEEVAHLVNSWSGSNVLPDWVRGVGDIQVTLSGPWRQLVVGAQLDAHPFELPPIQIDRLVTEGTIRGSQLVLGPTRFSVGEGSGEVEGSLSWADEVGPEQLDLTLRGNRVPLANAAAWMGATGSATGVFSFTGGLRGSLASPRGSWAVGMDDATLMGQELGDGSTTVDLAGGRFDGRGLSFDRGLAGSVWWDVVNSNVGGKLQWAEMPTTFLPDPMGDLVGGQADVAIDFRLPRNGHPTGRVEVVFPEAYALFEADQNEVSFNASVRESITATASLARTADGGLRGPGEIRLESAADIVSRLIADSGLPLDGTARAAVTVDWPAGAWPRFEGELVDLGLELDQRPIRLLSPSHFDLSDRGFHTTGLHVAVLDDQLFLRFGVDAEGQLTGNVSGTMDALLMRFLLPEWEPAGRATGVVELLGSVDRPLLEGIAEINQGSFRIPDSRTIFSGIDGTLLLSSDHAVLEGVNFRFMQGVGRCGGRLTLLDGTVELGLNGSIAGMQYEMFPGLVAFLSGSWRLEGPAEDLDIAGDITVDRASLRRKDDVPTLLVDWFADTAPVSAASGGPRLDLHLEADQTIEVRNPFVRLVGSASLDISGTTGEPGIVGKVEFEEGGEVMVQTLRYELERGTLTFSDPTRTDPFIDLQANTWVQNYQISVRIAGTPDRLTTLVASNPPLTEEEIFSMMAVGYRREGIGGGAMGVNVASTMLTREIAAELDRRTRLLLPVDQVRVDPFAETASGNPTARLSVVKQLSPTWTFILQSNLSAQREEVVVSRWYLAPGLFVEASRDLDGSYGCDIKLRRPY